MSEADNNKADRRHLAYYLRNELEDSRTHRLLEIVAAVLVVPGLPLLWWLVNPVVAVVVSGVAAAFFPLRHVFFRRSPRPLAVLHTPEGDEIVRGAAALDVLRSHGPPEIVQRVPVEAVMSVRLLGDTSQYKTWVDKTHRAALET